MHQERQRHERRLLLASQQRHERRRFRLFKKNQLYKYFMRQEIHSSHLLALKDTQNVFWSVTLNVNITFVCLHPPQGLFMFCWYTTVLPNNWDFELLFGEIDVDELLCQRSSSVFLFVAISEILNPCASKLNKKTSDGPDKTSNYHWSSRSCQAVSWFVNVLTSVSRSLELLLMEGLDSPLTLSLSLSLQLFCPGFSCQTQHTRRPWVNNIKQNC